MVAEYGSKVPQWYAGQCPILADGQVILAPAGPTTLVMAVDCETGRVGWSVPNPDGWRMSHSSIIPMMIDGRSTYVYFAQGGAMGMSHEGKVLWKTDLWNFSVVSPSPVSFGPDRLLITSGYGAGSMELIVNAGVVSAGKVWKKTEFACEQQTPLFHDRRFYSVMPKDAGSKRERLVCMDENGKVRWYS